jgi:hypothetical protein
MPLFALSAIAKVKSRSRFVISISTMIHDQ